MGEILVGTSGFSFDDWVGEVYPPGTRRQDMLPYYVKHLGFKTLEVNYTYYSMPSVKTMESFARRTPSDFAFVVKAFSGITHSIDADVSQTCRFFKEGISPLGDSLKALLFQFPYTFLPTDSNRDYLKKLRDDFPDYESVIEFRNAQWFNQKYFDLLRDLSLGFCVVDEPKLKGLMPFTPVRTSRTGYFRFHGRNRSWFREPVDVRYDYLYSDKELQGFIEPILNVASSTDGETFVFFNNCHSGKAARNALTMIELLKTRPAYDMAKASHHN